MVSPSATETTFPVMVLERVVEGSNRNTTMSHSNT